MVIVHFCGGPGGGWEMLTRPIRPFISAIDVSDLNRAMDDSDLYAFGFNPSRLCRDEQPDRPLGARFAGGTRQHPLS